MKINTVLHLTGKTSNNTVAKTHQATEVVAFSNNNVRVNLNLNGSITVKTKNGTYVLTAHPTIVNLWTGIAQGIKVHFTKKKIVGKLIYWA